MIVSEFSLTIPGTPTGKGRPRIARGRAYTPKETVAAEEAVRTEWFAKGCPTLGDGPITMTVRLRHSRPASHLLKDGSLSKAGRRFATPHGQKPDVDNAIKLILDSLNGLAWKDDVQIIGAYIFREWGHEASTHISAEVVA